MTERFYCLRVMYPKAVSPVSYTHLDVYKRQAFACPDRKTGGEYFYGVFFIGRVG